MIALDPTELGRKIRQHDNEFEALYELVGRVDRKVDVLEVKVDAGFERVDAQLTDVNGKLDAILQRLSSRSPGRRGHRLQAVARAGLQPAGWRSGLAVLLGRSGCHVP